MAKVKYLGLHDPVRSLAELLPTHRTLHQWRLTYFPFGPEYCAIDKVMTGMRELSMLLAGAPMVVGEEGFPYGPPKGWTPKPSIESMARERAKTEAAGTTMCNRYRFHLPLERLVEDFSHTRIPLRFSEDARPSNADIQITDPALIIRNDAGGALGEMLRWSWPQSATNKRPVFNFVSEGRRFPVETRCIIPATGFYEHTDPTEPGKKTKDRWRFTANDAPIFGIAGKWVFNSVSEERRWTMLTTAPGPDIAPIHDRQIVILRPDQWGPWLQGAAEVELLRPSPEGTLSREMVV